MFYMISYEYRRSLTVWIILPRSFSAFCSVQHYETEQTENKNEEIGDILCFPFVFDDFKELQVWVVIITQIRFVVFHMLSNQ